MRILIYRPDNIGDVVLFTGAFEHIRRLYPDSHITLAVQPHIINLVELCPFVDEVVSIYEFAYWIKLQKLDIKGSWRFRLQIRSLEKVLRIFSKIFDLNIFPVKSPNNEALQILSGIKFKKLVGIVGSDMNLTQQDRQKLEQLCSDYLDVSIENPWIHELYMTVDFLNFLGATVENIEQIDPVIWLSETDKIFVDNLNLTTPVIGLFPSASNSIRNWSLSNYGLVAKNLSDKVTYIILGGSQDIELANKLKDELHAACPAAKVLNIAGKTTLRQLYVSICACTILISVESAALHMGIASGTPTVGIAGGGHYGRFVPWGNLKNNIIATNELSCFHCNWKCSREKIECIDGVSADDVVTAVTKLLPSLSRDYGLHGNKLC